MSLFAMTGFDHNSYQYRFGVAGSIANNGRFGRGRYARFSNGNHYCSVKINPGDEYHSWVIGYACREVANPYTDLAYESSFIEMSGDSGQGHIQIYWTSPVSGQYAIRARRGDGTILGTSSNIALTNGIWRYMEFKVVIDETNGMVEVRRDGVVVLSLTNIDTRNGGGDPNVYNLKLGQNANNSYGSLDDVYILYNDGSGLTDYLGETEVESLVPNGNGTYSEQTGSDADQTDNYLHVDDSPGVNDGDFVASSTDGHRDTYTMTDLVRTNATVYAAAFSYRVRKDDTDPKSVRRVIRTNGSDNVGSDFALPSTYIWNQEILEQNPITATDWTVNDINNIEHGTEVRP